MLFPIFFVLTILKQTTPLTCEWYGATNGVDIQCFPGWAAFGYCGSGRRKDCNDSPGRGKYSYMLYCCQTKYQNHKQDNCDWTGHNGGSLNTCKSDEGAGAQSYNRAIYGGCGSSNNNDCLVNGTMYTNSEMCCDNLDINVSSDDDCGWKYGTFGENIQCPSNYIVAGLCGSEGKAACDTGNVNSAIGIYCCPYSDNSRQNETPKIKDITYKETMHLPKVIIFDLDGTLFNFTVDYAKLPSKRINNKPVWDPTESEIQEFKKTYKIFEDVQNILDDIKHRRDRQESLNSRSHPGRESTIKIGIASKAHFVQKGIKVLEIFNLLDYFDPDLIFLQCTNKTEHFQKIKNSYDNKYDQNISYEDMLFFDDDKGNITTICRLGCSGYLCNDRGMTWDNYLKGLKMHDDNFENKKRFPDNFLTDF